MFKILNRNREVVGLITSPINPIIEDNLTGMNELKFSVPATQEGLELEGYIRIENEHEYVIKEISTHGHNREVIAIMNVEELIGKVWTTFRSVDTYPTACIREIVAGTGWTVVDNCPPNKRRNLYGTQISSWDLIFLACDVWGIEVKFDTHNKVITTQEKGGTDRGTYFMSDLNLKQLMHDSHTHKLITRVIPIGKDGLTIEKVNGGKNYISNHSYSNKVITGIWQSDRYTKAQDLMDDAREYLAEMCVPYESYECKVSDLYRLEKNPNFEFNVGDIIYLIDNITKKKIQQRIIKHTKNLTSPDKDTINLANKSMSFTDYYKRLQLISNMTEQAIGSDGLISNGSIESVDADKITGDIKANLLDVDTVLSEHIKADQILAGHIKSDQIYGEHIVSEEIDTRHLKANSIKTEHIDAGQIEADHIQAGAIQTGHIDAGSINAGHIQSGSINSNHIEADSIGTTHLQANSIEAGHINANSITTNHLQADSITTQHLQADSITSDHIQTGAITAGSSIIAEGAIGSAQISSLDANKIDAGEINTAKVKIKGENGFLFIENNTLYVVDNKRQIRCELGVIENNSNYGFVVRGADGQTIMLDHNGVHNAGITDGAIDNRKVSENANISGKKLDIDSVVKSINEDGSVTLKGTKIQVGNTTLDVKLSEQNNLITAQGQQLATQKSEISANTNAIKLKVDNQTYKEDKKNMTSSLSKATSDISVLQEQIALKVEQKDITNAVDTLSGAVEQKIIDAKAEIKATTDEITQRVSSTESTLTATTNKIDNLQVGGRNLLKDTSSELKDVTFGGWDYYFPNHLTTWVVGEQLTGRIYLKPTNQDASCMIHVRYTDSTYTQTRGNIVKAGTEGYSIVTTKVNPPSGKVVSHIQFSIRHSASNTPSDKVYYKEAKVEKGNKATDWTPAPEDVDSKITTTNSKVAELITSLDDITQRVSSTESSTTTLTQKVDVTVKEVKVYYAINASSSTAPTSGWSTTPPTWVEGKYIWSKNTTTLTDGTSTSTNPVCITGAKGATGATGAKGDKGDTGASGKGVKSITNYYLASSSNSGVTTSTSGWTTTVQSVSNSKKYLWNYEQVTYTDNTSTNTSPCVIGAYGDTGSTGATGKGIKSIVEYYVVSSSNTTAPTSGWTTAMQNTTTTNKYLWNYEVITYTDNTTSETTKKIIGTHGAKGDTGASGKGVSSIANYYLATNSNSGVTASTSGWTTTVQSVTSSKKYLWNYEKVTYTDNSVVSTSPCIIGAYGDKGATGATGASGKGIKSIVEYYAVSNSNTTAPSSWVTTPPNTTTTNKYLWNYEVITYTDGSTTNTTKKVIGTHGDKGDKGATGASGKGVSNITNYYLATNSNSGVTPSTSGWSTTVQSVSSSKKYLWNYEKVAYTDNTTASTTPCIIGAYGDTGSAGAKGDKGDTGATGKGIKSIVEYYAVSSSNTTAPTNWSTTVQTTTTTNKYLWNYEVITYTDSSTTSTPKKVIGTHGATGDKGSTGATGTGIASITTEYYLSTSKTTQTGGSWVTSQPTWSNGKYLWTRSKIVYKNPTSTEYTTPVCDSSYEAINDMQVGGRNLLSKTKDSKTATGNNTTNQCVSLYNLTASKSDLNTQKVTLSFTYTVSNYTGGYFKIQSHSTVYNSWSSITPTGNGTFTFKGTITTASNFSSNTGVQVRMDNFNGTIVVSKMKLEKGDKATDWTPAPEDMESTVSAIETRVQDAESKLTKTSLTTTIGNHYTTTSDVDGIITKKGYSTTSEVKQTVDSLSAKFSSSGGYNLLRNSSGKNGVNHWVNSNLTSFASNTDATQSNIALTSAKARFNLGNSTTSEKFAYSHRFELSANKTYTISGKYYVGDGSKGLDLYLLISNSITSTGNSSLTSYDTSVGCASSSSYTGKWVEFSKTYTTGSSTKTGVIRLDHNGTNTDGTSKNVYFADLLVTEGEMKLAWSPHPSEVYDGITKIDKDGIQVSQSNISTNTKMNASGFYIQKKDGTNVFKVDSGGLKMTGDIQGSTFSSANNIFKVLSDGTVEADDINVSGTVSTNTLTVDKISNPRYPEVLDKAMTVYIKNGATSPDGFYHGAVYGSFKDMLAVAPRNLQGYTLDIVMQSNITENVSLTWFTSGQVDISFQGYTLYGYLFCYGASMVYRLYGGNGDDAKMGKIMPSCGRSMGGYYYALVFQYCQFAINNIGLYPDTTNTTNSGGICANRGARGNIFNATAYGSMRYLVRAEYGSHVYVGKTSGTCNNATFCGTTGSIISINNDNTQAGRSTSGNPYWVGSGAMIVNNQVLGMSNITFGTTANSGSNTNTSTGSSQTVTETITASLADTYRSTVYNNWKKDGTVRQGEWGYGNCTGLWFFDNKLSSVLAKGTTKSVSIKITRQSGGNSGAVTHTLKVHNHATRPSGAPTMGSTITTFSLATGASTTLNLTSAQITTLKSGKGIGLQSSYSNSTYSVCSGTVTIKVTYTT